MRIIQKFAKNKLARVFNWKRVMKSVDMKETHKLSNSLLYLASQPVTKPAIFEDEEDEHHSGRGDKDNTFLTSGGRDSSGSAGDSAPAYPRRRVSRASFGEVSPELARLQMMLHVEVDDVQEEKRVGRRHFSISGRRDSGGGGGGYFQGMGAQGRPSTAPAGQESQQDNELEAQEALRGLNRHERRAMLASASTSSVRAVSAARNLLRGPSSSSLMATQRERPKSAAEVQLEFTSEEEEVEDYDEDKEEGAVSNESDHKDTKRFSPKTCIGEWADLITRSMIKLTLVRAFIVQTPARTKFWDVLNPKIKRSERNSTGSSRGDFVRATCSTVTRRAAYLVCCVVLLCSDSNAFLSCLAPQHLQVPGRERRSAPRRVRGAPPAGQRQHEPELPAGELGHSAHIQRHQDPAAEGQVQSIGEQGQGLVIQIRQLAEVRARGVGGGATLFSVVHGEIYKCIMA